MSYADAMTYGAQAYADAIDALTQRGLPTVFTQTGGMCAALEATIEGGYLLITDFEGPLEWDRADHEGWLVGLYLGEEDEARRYKDSRASDVETLLELVDAALRSPG